VVGGHAGGNRLRLAGRHVGQGADDRHAGARPGSRLCAQGTRRRRRRWRRLWQDVALRDHHQTGHLRSRTPGARRVVLVGAVQLRPAPHHGRERRDAPPDRTGPAAAPADQRRARRARRSGQHPVRRRNVRAGRSTGRRRGRGRRGHRRPFVLSAGAGRLHTHQQRLT